MHFGQTTIAKIEEKIYRDHEQVQYIKVDYLIVLVKEFVQNAGDIAEDQNDKKERAFSFYRPGYIRFVDGERPGGSKTKEHKSFKDTHIDAS